MARRWTPQSFIKHRRWRVGLCAAFVVIACLVGFFFVAMKTVTISYDGKIRTAHTMAMTPHGLLTEQGIPVKSHDFITSSHGDLLRNGDTVTVRTAYQATITIDGQVVYFWTYAQNAADILNFFKQSERNAVKVSVDINNVYNTLTGGFVISAKGPVYLQVDGKKIRVADGDTTAAAILDAHNVQLGKNDRVNVVKEGTATIMRVQRVSYATSTKQVILPYTTQRIDDPSLPQGAEVISQEGKTGLEVDTYRNVLVDGKVESSALIKREVTSYAVNEIISVGTKKSQPQPSSDGDSSFGKDSQKKGAGDSSSQDSSKSSSSPSSQSSDSASGSSSGSSSPRGDDSQGDKSGQSGQSDQSDQQNQNSQGDSSSGKDSAKAKVKPDEAARKAAEAKAAADRQAQQKAAAKAAAARKEAEERARRQQEAAVARRRAQAAAAAAAQRAQAQQQASSTWHATPAQAQVYGRAAAAQYGWTGAQWDAVVWLFNKESSWMWSAENPGSGAYGIPQALPGSKMATAGADWRDNAATQINWGLGYIRGRYGNPLTAKAYHLRMNWY